MDSSQKYDNPNPEVKANQFSKIFYCWLFPLFKYGYNNELEVKNLYNTAQSDLSGLLGNKLEKHWQEELVHAKKNNKKPCLNKAIRRTFLKPFIFYGIGQFIQSVVCRFSQPVILASLIKHFDDTRTSTPQNGWFLGTNLVVLGFISIILLHYPALELNRICMQCRVATCSVIYRKLLRLNKSSTAKTTAGQIVNLLSNDAFRFDMAALFLNYMWIMPISFIILSVLMYNTIGIAALIGVLALTIQTLPLQSYLSTLKGKLRLKIASHTDRRVQVLSEITSGIRVIKMYAWERAFEKLVNSVRKLELNKIKIASYIWGFVSSIARFTERLTTLIIMVSYVLLGNHLSSAKVFSIVQYISILQLYTAILFPMAVSCFSEAKVSIKRIEDFLMLDETLLDSDIKTLDEKSGTIKLHNIKASWLQNQIVDTLNINNLHIKPGLIYAIVGPIGAGKTSLLQVFLKELSINQGSLEITGSISYASQEPWLFSSSVRNNILFGLPYIKSKYKNVIKVCALEQDFKIFPNGDHTLVGERGTSLSGGQRARINLARAIYSDADIYLLDDPLSAVDTHVGRHLFEKCIIEHLEKKTRILVTHQLQFLKHVDQIIVIKNGQIEKIGTYAEFANEELEHLNLKSVQEESSMYGLEKQGDLDSLVSEQSDTNVGRDDADHEEGPLETQELMEKGNIPTSLYLDYFRNGNGICLLLCTVMVIIATQLFSISIDIWLTHWTKAEERYYVLKPDTASSVGYLKSTGISETSVKNNSYGFVSENTTKNCMLNNTGSPLELSNYNRVDYIYVYTALMILAIIFTTVRSIAVYKVCLNASKKLHNKMFSNVLKATMHFFDTNPSGRILSRFGKDVGILDEFLPLLLFESVQIISIMVGVLIVIFIVSPMMIIPTAFMGILFLLVRKIYLATASQIKRIEGLTRAPVLSHVAASIHGLVTIRVSHAQAMITQEFDTLQDQHTSSYFLYLAICEAFGFYLDLISIIFIGIVVYQFLIFDDGKTPSANVGLSISQALVLTGMLQFGVRQTTEFSSQMVSVERIVQYTRLKEETPFESPPAKKPNVDWPQFGKITFKNLTLQYVDDEPSVLKHLNVHVHAGSKVGIVGRTGAGKSSLTAALFRLAPTEGSIIIDDIEINEIGLHDLRRKISIIPQEPILFTASVRYNLDPMEKYEDQILWNALEDVELKEHIGNLDENVSEGGSNFSVGQRQLLCLARAILQNNKILVMDEATANVDLETDQLIQATIRKKFKNCTVLTIAHRLNTIMDSDMVLVMDAGEAVEYGCPFELLQSENGFFRKMLKETGPGMENKLQKIAEDTYNNTFKNVPKNHEFLDENNLEVKEK